MEWIETWLWNVEAKLSFDYDCAIFKTRNIYFLLQGLKTGMYYLRTKPAAQAIQFTVDKTKLKTKTQEENEAAMVCSLENKEACMMCSG